MSRPRPSNNSLRVPSDYAPLLTAPLPEHRAAKIAAVHGKRAKLYEKRQHLLNLGPHALTLLTEITHRAPRLAGRRVEELYWLLERHGDDRVREAIQDAVERERFTVSAVRRRLPSSVRQGDASGRHTGAAQPRDNDAGQLAFGFHRAESKGRAS